MRNAFDRNPLAFIGAIVVILVALGLPIFLALGSRWLDNKIDYAAQKIDENTQYEVLREVEDTARAMISSYEADKITWEQYKDAEGKEQRGWGESAKTRANRTAAVYNNYLLKNSFVWENNIPNDISESLPFIE